MNWLFDNLLRRFTEWRDYRDDANPVGSLYADLKKLCQ